jgi:hypothetical protein
MIGTDGGCAHEPDPTALQKLTGYSGNRTNQQYIGVPDIRVRHGTTRHPSNLTDVAKEGVQQGNVFVCYDQHDDVRPCQFLRWR